MVDQSITKIIETVYDGMMSVFHYQEIALIALLGLLVIVLAKFKADRFTVIFVFTCTAGMFAYYGLLDTPLVWGLTLMGGGLIVFHSLRLMFS